MDLPVHIAFSLVVELVALGGATVVAYRVTVHHGATPTPAEWRAQAVAASRDLHEALDGHGTPVDREAVTRSALPLVGRFDRLARESPRSVDRTLVTRLYELGVACRRLGVEYPGRTDGGWDESYADRVADVAARADGVARDIDAAGATVTA